MSWVAPFPTTQKPEGAVGIIKEYEEILCAKRKSIIVVAFTKGRFLNASRRETEIPTNGKRVKDSQEYNYFKNQSF